MKKLFLFVFVILVILPLFGQITMQGTIKRGNMPNAVDIYLKPFASFTQKDEQMNLTLAIPAGITPAPALGSAGVTLNGTGPENGITGLQPKFLTNNLGTLQREVVVSKENIEGQPHYIYTFIFATTAQSDHVWKGGEEQLVFSVSFENCTAGCEEFNAFKLVSLPNGGASQQSYWYFQVNTLGDITNYSEPFYENPNAETAKNGGSIDGSALSYIQLSIPIVVPVKLVSFIAENRQCNSRLSWQVANEINLTYYAIERSNNSIEFTEVGRVPSSSQNAATKSYRYNDNDISNIKNLFYRLRMVDKDEKFEYSPIKQVSLNCPEKVAISVYPTLSNGLVNIKLSSGLEQSTIRITNSLGQEIIVNESKGFSRILNLKNFVNGVYFLQIVHNGKILDNFKIILHR